MGVRGLKKFITTECQLLQDYRLHNTRVVIDGMNLLQYLYDQTQGSFCGGEFPALEYVFAKFLKDLLVCGVSPYVLFDGGLDPSDRKIQTKENRYLRRLSEVQEYILASPDEEWVKIAPHLSDLSMKCVLKEMNVPYATCTFEADEEIAWLAREWNCPVISDDSDFTIFDLPAGVIPLDTFAIEDGNEYKYMKVKIFKYTSLMKKFSLSDPKMLPLFASLVGNDCVDASMMEQFLSSVELPWVADQCYTNWHQMRKAKVLLWLSTIGNRDEALSIVLNAFSDIDKVLVKKKLDISLASYVMRDSVMRRHFERLDNNRVEDYLRAIPPCDLGSVKTFNGREVPKWMIARLWLGCMPRKLLDVLVFHRDLLFGLLEQPNAPSAYQGARHIRQLIYGILFTLELPITECETVTYAQQRRSNNHTAHNNKRALHVEEWSRDRDSIGKIPVQPLFSTPDGTRVPHFTQIPNMDLQDRVEFFCHATDIPSGMFMTLPAQHRLVLAAAAVWIRSSSPPIWKNQVLALLAYIAQGSLWTRTTDALTHATPAAFFGSGDSQNKNHKAGPEEDRLKVTYRATPQNCDIGVTHAYAQFQACLEAVLYLNQLLCCPLEEFTPSKVYSGVYIYTLVRDLNLVQKLGKDPKEEVTKCLRMISEEAAATFLALYSFLLS